MKIVCRRDQFSFFLGFASRHSEHMLDEALRLHKGMDQSLPSPADVFEYCPYNDSFEQVVRSVRIFESGKRRGLSNIFQSLVD